MGIKVCNSVVSSNKEIFEVTLVLCIKFILCKGHGTYA